MRKIKFKLLTQSTLVTIDSNARTFADLQNEIQQNAELKDVIHFGKSQFVNNADKTVYGNIPDAVLPAVDCLFYVVPTETKSGCDLPTIEDVVEMSYTELRSLGSKLNKENGASIDLTGKRVDILPRVVDFLVSQAPEDEPCDDSAATEIVACANKIIALVETWKAENKAAQEDVVFKLTAAEVETEAQRLKSLLK